MDRNIGPGRHCLTTSVVALGADGLVGLAGARGRDGDVGLLRDRHVLGLRAHHGVRDVLWQDGLPRHELRHILRLRDKVGHRLGVDHRDGLVHRRVVVPRRLPPAVHRHGLVDGLIQPLRHHAAVVRSHRSAEQCCGGQASS